MTRILNHTQKTFVEVNKKFELKPEIHVLEKQGEEPPTEAIKQMMQKHADQIKNRAQLPVITDEDRADLTAAPLDSLAYIHYQDGENEIYLVKYVWIIED